MAVPLILIRLGDGPEPIVPGIGKATVSDATVQTAAVSDAARSTATISDDAVATATVSDDP